MNAIIGACVGDAAGATLEFYHGPIIEEVALKSMRMPGGGSLGVGPGQITDDGELTITLWQALKNHNPADGFPYKSVVQAYANWFNSYPFDIGRTCSLAFGHTVELLDTLDSKDITKEDIYMLKTKINRANKFSEANGALMRATALATWVATNEYIEAFLGAEMAMEDASLSHPNQICQEVNAIYVFTLINLLRGIHPADAIKYTDEFMAMNDFSEIVKKWYFEESLDIRSLNAKEQRGWVRWGFVLSFYFLRNPDISYEEAIKVTLMKGGDTDTNAAIVGGLVACYQPIPEYMSHPVLVFDCTTQNRRRPSEYSVRLQIN